MGLYLGDSDLIGGNSIIQNINANTNILQLFPIRYYLYGTTTFTVPFDTYLTIRACGKGGAAYSYTAGGGGGGYTKDYRFYNKGDVINITFSSGKVTVTQSNKALNLVANPGAAGASGNGGAGGTASGGNLLNATGGRGGFNNTAPGTSQGCGGGGYIDTSYLTNDIFRPGATGGFSGGNGNTADVNSSYGAGVAGGQGGFSGGNGGISDSCDSYKRTGGAGGYSPYGIGGNGGNSLYSGTGGAGGTGFIAGGNGGASSSGTGGKGGDCTGSSLAGKGGTGSTAGANGQGTEGNPPFLTVPKRTNHGGGNGGIAACIISIGDDTANF